MRTLCVALSGAVLLALAGLTMAEERADFAVSDFSFRDTSGETRDQSAEHAARLRAFNAILRSELSDSGAFTPVALDCGTAACSIGAQGIGALAERARRAEARYLLVGEVHKMSTLVGWVRFAVLDLDKDASVCDRFLTYRGDTDEAWRRAAAYTVRDLGRYCRFK
ncbi:DUF2380 domain-containing protein [Nitratireductor sp. GCM10026969]|uniref:DUF2380 domain-containing protein n=1 Tax=Nitratireductor sp. GCM10026969 TaxID=3252645 RepID=UPI00360E7928